MTNITIEQIKKDLSILQDRSLYKDILSNKALSKEIYDLMVEIYQGVEEKNNLHPYDYEKYYTPKETEMVKLIDNSELDVLLNAYELLSGQKTDLSFRPDNKVIQLLLETDFSFQTITKINWDIITDDNALEIVKRNGSLIKTYNGKNQDVVEEGLKTYTPTEEDIKNNNNIPFNKRMMEKAIQSNPELIKYLMINISDDILKEALSKYKPTEEDFQNNQRLTTYESIFEICIPEDPNIVRFYKGNNASIAKEALKYGYKPPIEELKQSENSPYLILAEIVPYLLSEDIKLMELYNGDRIEYLRLKEDIKKESYQNILKTYYNYPFYDAISTQLIERNENLIKNYKGSNETIYKLAIQKGYKPTIEECDDKEIWISLLGEDYLNNLINNIEEKDVPSKYKNANSEKIREKIRTQRLNNLPPYLCEILLYYKNDKDRLINNYPMIKDFLESISIDPELFLNLSIGDLDDWYSDIKIIVDYNDRNQLQKSFQAFLEKMTNKDTTNNEFFLVKESKEFFKKYAKYKELIDDISNLERDLSEEERDLLSILFNTNMVISEENIPKKVEEIPNILQILIKTKKDIIKKVKEKDKYEAYRDAIILLLFDVDNPNHFIMNYGSTEKLKQLRFENRNNKEIQEDINFLILFGSTIEDIVRTKDISLLKEMLDKIEENLEEITKDSMLFKGINEKYRRVCEKEIQANLTRIDDIDPQYKESLIDKEKNKRYGVETLDFSNQKYILIAHVISPRERVYNLVNGLNAKKRYIEEAKKTIPEQNVISTTPISHRKQSFHNYERIAFATDEYPENSLIRTGEYINSNSDLHEFSTAIRKSSDMNPGILSSSELNGAEIFSYRKGLKFKYILLPGGREPTEEEINVAKEYGLKFIITQETGKTIINPKKVIMKDRQSEEKSRLEKELKELKRIREELINNSKKQPKHRKIAIFGDSHGLFEPTLAVLEDCREKGITEIYSLGDNIGTGPNPKEVMDLLKEYKVKSVKGNHEIYASDGVDSLKEHLYNAGGHFAYEEAKHNSEYTKSKLTEEQIQTIKDMPYEREIDLDGKKILLTHTVQNYDDGSIDYYKCSKYDKVFQGHVHFKRMEENYKVNTLRGLAIGFRGEKSTDNAYYITVENVDGKLVIEEHYVSYGQRKTMHDINESKLPEGDKRKMVRWTNGPIKTRNPVEEVLNKGR